MLIDIEKTHESLSDRQRTILQKLTEAGGNLTSSQLETLFDVSVQTIRKDLNILSKLGLVRRVHGGIKTPVKSHNLSFANRQVIHLEAKQKIAKELVAQLPKKSSLFLGIGTTPLQVAIELSKHQGYTVVTNNLNIALVLSQNIDITVYLSGGKLRHTDQDLMGTCTDDFLAQFQVNCGIFGVGGISASGDLLDFSLDESQISKVIMKNCERRILAADSSKFGRHALIKTAHLADIDELYMEKIPEELGLLCDMHDVDINHTDSY